MNYIGKVLKPIGSTSIIHWPVGRSFFYSIQCEWSSKCIACCGLEIPQVKVVLLHATLMPGGQEQNWFHLCLHTWPSRIKSIEMPYFIDLSQNSTRKRHCHKRAENVSLGSTAFVHTVNGNLNSKWSLQSIDCTILNITGNKVNLTRHFLPLITVCQLLSRHSV